MKFFGTVILVVFVASFFVGCAGKNVRPEAPTNLRIEEEEKVDVRCSEKGKILLERRRLYSKIFASLAISSAKISFFLSEIKEESLTEERRIAKEDAKRAELRLVEFLKVESSLNCSLEWEWLDRVDFLVKDLRLKVNEFYDPCKQK